MLKFQRRFRLHPSFYELFNYSLMQDIFYKPNSEFSLYRCHLRFGDVDHRSDTVRRMFSSSFRRLASFADRRPLRGEQVDDELADEFADFVDGEQSGSEEQTERSSDVAQKGHEGVRRRHLVVVVLQRRVVDLDYAVVVVDPGGRRVRKVELVNVVEEVV